MSAPILTTRRLHLRAWRTGDLLPFFELNADPRVMEYFPSLLTRSESDLFAETAQEKLVQRQFGLWAVEVQETAQFIGFVGLAVPVFQVHFTPCVEIGWRLAFHAWGKGFATEGAEVVRDHAFGVLGLSEVVSFTTVRNARSRKVMERLGMRHSPADDFDHPTIPVGHPFRRHVLYRLSRSEAAAVGTL